MPADEHDQRPSEAAPEPPDGQPATPPDAGLSLWAELPVASADAFAHAAARHGVTVTPGSTACVCGAHGHYIRLSFAEQPGTLELAAERLAAVQPMAGDDDAIGEILTFIGGSAHRALCLPADDRSTQ